MSEYIPHVHGYIRFRHPLLALVLAKLHLPWGWLIESGESPHDPECTSETGVVRG
jgi:hypothetical protein